MSNKAAPELPEKQARLYAFLLDRGDVPIPEIHRHLFDRQPKEAVSAPHRFAQQELGPLITRLNRRLRQHGRAVKPGRLKGTYALVDL